MLESLARLILPCCLVGLAALPAKAAPLRVRTDDTQLGFAIIANAPVITELRVPGRGISRNWVSQVPEASLPKSAEIAGATQELHWKYAETITRKNAVSFVYRCGFPRLEATSTWSAVSGPGPVEHELALRNLGDTEIRFAPTPTIALSLLAPKARKLEHWWVHKGAGYTLEEGGTYTESVGPAYEKALHSGPYSSDDANRDAVPWLCLHDPNAAQGLYGGIEFSGWTELLVKRTSDGTVALSLGLQPRDGQTRARLLPGAQFAFPTCFVGAYKGEVDDGCNRLHRWTESHLRPPMPGGTTPVLVNNSWGSGMAVDEPLARKMIDDCAALGIELYHVDAGWYKNVGDWHANPAKFPKGLQEIADYTHSKGLKFGLWVGWTQGGSGKGTGPEALSVFNPAQKDWFGADAPADWNNWEFTGIPVCLGAPGARDWCLNDLQRMVKEYKLDLLEHDQIMIVDACSRTDHDHLPNDPVDVSRAAAEGYYAVYDQLRKDHPTLLFEDCVNGGRQIDFGVAKRAHYLCVTDTYDPATCRRAFYDNSYPLPPSMIELYLANVPGDSIASFRSMVRSAMLGWCTIMIDTSQWSPAQHEAAKREFAFYKQKLRPLIAAGNFYHVLPRPNGKRWEGFQYHDPKTGNGALFAFRSQSGEETQTIRLRGLDPARRYNVESADGSLAKTTQTGKDLATTGLTLRLTEKEASDLIFLTAVR